MKSMLWINFLHVLQSVMTNNTIDPNKPIHVIPYTSMFLLNILLFDTIMAWGLKLANCCGSGLPSLYNKHTHAMTIYKLHYCNYISNDVGVLPITYRDEIVQISAMVNLLNALGGSFPSACKDRKKF